MPSELYRDAAGRLARGDGSAVAAIVRLAEAGDADAMYKAAEFQLTGLLGRVDTRASFRWMAAAAKRGHVEARRAHAYFTAAGLGCPADPSRARAMLEAIAPEDRFVQIQLAVLERLTCRERLRTAERRLVSRDPHVELVLALFSPQECRYLQHLATPTLQPAMILTGVNTGARDPHRDSDNAVIPPMAEDLVVQTINACIADASRTRVGWGEPLTVLRYRPGQQYRPHFDAHDLVPVKQRRLATALLYLNDDYQGGETEFPELNFRVQAGTGDLLIFHNLTADKKPDGRMLHAGRPVTRGEKWLATRWIRAGDYFSR